MKCLGCNLIETKPVKLHDGTTVCSSCEGWRHECEARAIMALPGTSQRREWLEQIGTKRGMPAREALQNTIKALWPSR